MPRLDKQCLNFGKQNRRDLKGSIYDEDFDIRQDPQDLQKIQHGKIKTTKGSERKCYMEMRKQ